MDSMNPVFKILVRTLSVHTYNQDLVSVIVAHCNSYAPKVCSHCSRCCCCLLLYDKQRMGIHLNSARGPGLYHRSWPLSFLHLPSIPSSLWLLSISRSSWHIPLESQQWWQDHPHIGPPREHQPQTHESIYGDNDMMKLQTRYFIGWWHV